MSTTDAEARVMKMADGGFRPAFNVQFAADTRSGAVAGVSVDNVGSDMGKMAPMSDALAATYGTRLGEHLADGGYAKLADIDHLAAAGVTAFVPVPKPRDPARDRFARHPDDTDAVAAWRARMNTDSARTIYKQRAATSERVNAQARNSGLTRLVVRGVDKAKAVACWHGLARCAAGPHETAFRTAGPRPEPKRVETTARSCPSSQISKDWRPLTPPQRRRPRRTCRPGRRHRPIH